MEELKAGARLDLAFVAVDDAKEQTSYLATPAMEGEARLSPDGRWVAFLSDSSGKAEVFVDSFPAPSRPQRVAIGGEPVRFISAPTDASCFVVAAEGGEAALYACELRPGAGIEIGRPQKLFSLPEEWSTFTPAPAGDRFLLLRPIGSRSPALVLVDSWRAQLGAAR